MNQVEVNQKIRQYLDEELGLDVQDLSDDEPLFEGILDSIEVIKLVLYLENTFDIRIDPINTTVTSFSTIGKIVDTVQSVAGK